MKPSASRLLLAAALAACSPQPAAFAVTVGPAPDPLGQAHAALADADFAGMKAALDPLLEAAPVDDAAYDDARILRAMARLGVAAEGDVPQFLRDKLGAKAATVDISSGTYDLTFPNRFVYGNADAFTVKGGTYSRASKLDGHASPGRPSAISFENNGTAPYTLTLRLTHGDAEELPGGELRFEINGELIGFLISEPLHPNPAFRYHLVSYSPEFTASEAAQTATVSIPVGASLSLALVYSQGDFWITPTPAIPSTLVPKNGKGVLSAREVISPKANASNFLTLAAALETATLAPAIADLAAVSADVNLVLPPEETGAAINTVIAYPDVQILLFELKFLQALRRLSSSYTFALPLTPETLANDPLRLLVSNPKFLTPLKPSRALSADRILARDLLSQAIGHYTAASESGLWERTPLESGTYLFALPGDGLDVREVFDGVLASLDQALTETIPLAGFDPEGLSQIPPTAGITLAPIFGSPAINPRKLIPVNGDDGIVRGGSLALLTSGLLPGWGTAGWEDYLAGHSNLDLITPPIQSAVKIQRQPTAFRSVAEFEPASFTVVAESYPAPTYKWYRRVGRTDQPVEGATSPTLSFESADRTHAGNYFVRVTNTVSRPPRAPVTTVRTSTPGVLEVTYAPEIVGEPADVTIYEDKTATLDVATIGVPKPKSFQWFKGEVAVTPIRTSSKYTFKASAASAGDYHVVVKNPHGEVTSETATVEIQTKPVFTQQPTAKAVVVGGSVTFEVEVAGNPMPLIKWRKNGKDIPGATGPSYTISPATAESAGTYTAAATNTVNTGPTTTAVLTTVSTGATLTVSAGLGSAM